MIWTARPRFPRKDTVNIKRPSPLTLGVAETTQGEQRRDVVKHAGDVVEILEAFDLTGSLREAARLTGCSPMTVARYVRLRERGQVAPDPVRRDQILDPYLAKLEEWVERSHGRVRADIAHEKLLALGFDGSERTTRRAVAGEGAERWLILAAASGTERIRTKMRRATELASLVGAASVEEALALAAEAGRFAEGDLESILDHRRLVGDRAGERLEPDDDTLQPGTACSGGYSDAGRTEGRVRRPDPRVSPGGVIGLLNPSPCHVVVRSKIRAVLKGRSAIDRTGRRVTCPVHTVGR